MDKIVFSVLPGLLKDSGSRTDPKEPGFLRVLVPEHAAILGSTTGTVAVPQNRFQNPVSDGFYNQNLQSNQVF